ncbi:related to 37S ribosomal protein S35, mitochondrial [Saccharomycodes ludwigii]|uniref:Related to 37S ribosomal protein S35, mitochondrial n=1 Tax=Saccharomycodes ludwigii TaxID=36035 RepID=A0A376B9K9_9ASCO|nr:hypothetical protein SCDLUD_004486 [Saccharomycodes ludwigii]KAH3899064.1 hypothetical protein SCDLUD_004486 [Saccharomycodes ludwigii]SSD61368.1 related to 37S ribosomal protein S35, mitochondrial [Saccharomycodes ludwigii]
MLSSTSRLKTTNKAITTQIQLVRNISRRRIAYPFYKFKKLGKTHEKQHDTNLKYAMRQFLGPRDYKGEYPFNKYFAVPTNHQPKYVTPDLERGLSLRDPITGQILEVGGSGSGRNTNLVPSSQSSRLSNEEDIQARINRQQTSNSAISNRRLQPFPANEFCQTNCIVGNELKEQIYQEIEVNHVSSQTVSQKYGLKIPRVEAIVKLMKIEHHWESTKSVIPDLQAMSETMYKMFPLFTPKQTSENLSEIPVPPKALTSRFMVLAESQPFGPVDASNVLGLEPAETTLEKLATLGEHSAHNISSASGSKNTKKHKVVYGVVNKGDKAILKFVNAKIGEVGYRYGAGNRDNKKDRKIGFNKLGQMIYI